MVVRPSSLVPVTDTSADVAVVTWVSVGDELLTLKVLLCMESGGSVLSAQLLKP